MRPALSVVSLLLLLLLLADEYEGARLLEDVSLASLHKEVHVVKESLMEEGSSTGGGLPCGSQMHCSGKSRKLMIMTNAMATSKFGGHSQSERSNNHTSIDSAQNNHNKHYSKAGEVLDREDQEDLHAAPPPASKQAQTYPDILDIAGMDYSPAKRKPPIHN